MCILISSVDLCEWRREQLARSIEMGGRQEQAKGSPTQTLDEAKDPTHSGPRNTLLLRHAGISRNCGALLLFKKGVKSCVFFRKGVIFSGHNPNLHAYPKDWALLKISKTIHFVTSYWQLEKAIRKKHGNGANAHHKEHSLPTPPLSNLLVEPKVIIFVEGPREA